jgi:hypothetical protein
MLAEAQLAATEEQITNTGSVQMRAEDLPGSLGTFRVISFAQSFHWMNRPRVASAVREMLNANGAVVTSRSLAHQPAEPGSLERAAPANTRARH